MIIDGFFHQLPDEDPEETDEWLAALDDIIAHEGTTRARVLMAKLPSFLISTRVIAAVPTTSTPSSGAVAALNSDPMGRPSALKSRMIRSPLVA